MKRITLRIPENIYSKLENVQKSKPHLSMNALIVEILSNESKNNESVRSGSSQLDPACIGAYNGD